MYTFYGNVKKNYYIITYPLYSYAGHDYVFISQLINCLELKKQIYRLLQKLPNRLQFSLVYIHRVEETHGPSPT